eukprot:5867170-Heterocapsa_arctica.AAC.1
MLHLTTPGWLGHHECSTCRGGGCGGRGEKRSVWRNILVEDGRLVAIRGKAGLVPISVSLGSLCFPM